MRKRRLKRTSDPTEALASALEEKDEAERVLMRALQAWLVAKEKLVYYKRRIEKAAQQKIRDMRNGGHST